jgi:Mg-chelatase subunit ChlD
MTNGTYINVRTFTLPYADYRGKFADNPFVLQGVQRSAEGPVEGRTEKTEEAFIEIARQANGDFIYASNPSDLIDIIENLLEREKGRSIDIVICLDTTGSMGRYIDSVRRMLIPMMRKTLSAAADWRIGMVLYRDYPPDSYITKIIPFTKDFSFFQRNLNAIVTWGGGDVPEAVYEALYDGADKFPWAAESRLLVLAGDAPPHSVQRGEISQEMAFQKIAGKGLKLSAILLPK